MSLGILSIWGWWTEDYEPGVATVTFVTPKSVRAGWSGWAGNSPGSCQAVSQVCLLNLHGNLAGQQLDSTKRHWEDARRAEGAGKLGSCLGAPYEDEKRWLQGHFTEGAVSVDTCKMPLTFIGVSSIRCPHTRPSPLEQKRPKQTRTRKRERPLPPPVFL